MHPKSFCTRICRMLLYVEANLAAEVVAMSSWHLVFQAVARARRNLRDCQPAVLQVCFELHHIVVHFVVLNIQIGKKHVFPNKIQFFTFFFECQIRLLKLLADGTPEAAAEPTCWQVLPSRAIKYALCQFVLNVLTKLVTNSPFVCTVVLLCPSISTEWEQNLNFPVLKGYQLSRIRVMAADFEMRILRRVNAKFLLQGEFFMDKSLLRPIEVPWDTWTYVDHRGFPAVSTLAAKLWLSQTVFFPSFRSRCKSHQHPMEGHWWGCYSFRNGIELSR